MTINLRYNNAAGNDINTHTNIIISMCNLYNFCNMVSESTQYNISTILYVRNRY